MLPSNSPATPVTRSATADPGQGPRRRLAALLIVGGLIGLVAAVVLLVEKVALLENPDYVPSCSINPVLSCGSVMTTAQAEAFGIPNPIIGIAGFAATVALGAALLAGGAFRRWFWAGIQIGVTFAVVFIHWLIYQSLYSIGALCPYCMIVWAVTIPIFWYCTVHNLQPLRRSDSAALARIVATVTDYRGAILTTWYLLILLLITHRFWDYWITLV